MKSPISVLAGICLCAFSLACSFTGKIAEAKADGGSRGQRVQTIAASPGSPARDWRLGAPVSFKNLTVFPVLSDEWTASVELITLDEGLRSGKVKITEMGADGASRAIDRRRNGDNAEVNRLALTNNSGKALVLIAGEMMLGGKQDRIVAHDCIIEATNAPVPLDVFCVEHGRWSGDVAFGQSRGSATGRGSSAGNGGNSFAVDAAAVAPMALPNVREKAQAKKSQTEVWGAVSETVTVNGSVSSTGDLNSVYQDKRVNKQLDDYERAFKTKMSENNVVGVVAAVGGKIVSADVFGNRSLFQIYWPKMLKSYALQAFSTTAAGTLQVSKTDAEAFLARVQGDDASGGKEGVYRLAENQSSADASFELEYTKKNARLVHFNRVAKK
jgi:hypothetical protein